MLVAAAVCPGPPALVPALTAGAATELEDLRTACDRALAVLGRGQLDRLVVLGPAGSSAVHDPASPPSLSRWGGAAPPDVDLDGRGPLADLPLSLAIGRFLLSRTPVDAGALCLQAVAESAPAEECRALGADLAGSAPRVGLLVVADGATCHDDDAPTAYDARAMPYDSMVAAALATADTATLAGLDPGLSRELGAGGRAPWQVLAGAADHPPADHAPADHAPADDAPGRSASGPGAARAGNPVRLRAELLSSSAPYGVGYHVAVWWRG